MHCQCQPTPRLATRPFNGVSGNQLVISCRHQPMLKVTGSLPLLHATRLSDVIDVTSLTAACGGMTSHNKHCPSVDLPRGLLRAPCCMRRQECCVHCDAVATVMPLLRPLQRTSKTTAAPVGTFPRDCPDLGGTATVASVAMDEPVVVVGSSSFGFGVHHGPVRAPVNISTADRVTREVILL